MRNLNACGILLALLLIGTPARADLFSFDLDATGSYSNLGNIEKPGTSDTGTVAGLGIGIRGTLQLLFVQAVVDWQHLFENADALHAGLGTGFKLESLPIVDIYVNGSVGILALYAEKTAFTDSDVNGTLGPEVGFQARAGGGIEIPFAADFLAFGLGLDLGVHHITGKFGYDLLVQVHLGLRI